MKNKIIALCLIIGIIITFACVNNSGKITLVNKNFDNDTVSIHFIPHVDLFSENLRISKNREPINIEHITIRRFDTVSKIPDEDPSHIYSSHYYILHFKDYEGTKYGDTYVLNWGEKMDLTVILDNPIIEIKNITYSDSGVKVTYYNSGGFGNVAGEDPLIITKGGEEINCFYGYSVAAVSFNIKNDEYIIKDFNYCHTDRKISAEDIDKITACTQLSTTTTRNCKTFEWKIP